MRLPMKDVGLTTKITIPVSMLVIGIMCLTALLRGDSSIILGLLPAIPVIVLAIHLLMKHLLAPLGQLTRLVEEFPYRERGGRLLPDSSGDEIGALARAFNTMAAELDRQKLALQEQLHFLQTLIDAIPAPIFYKDEAGRYLGCNTAFQTYLGRGKDEIVGKTVFDVAPPELAQVYLDADHSLFRHQGLQCYETAILFADGTIRDVMFYKATFANVDGSLGGLVGTLLDITERKAAEDALRSSEENFRRLFEDSRDAIFVLDRECRFVHANRSAIELFGYERHEIIGLDVGRIFCDPPCKGNLQAEIERTGFVRNMEVTIRRKDGTTGVCLLTTSAQRNAGGETLGFQGILHDITERKRAEEALRRHNEYLAALHETTIGLIGRHELHSLLQAIISRAGALMKTCHGYIYLLDPGGTELVKQVSMGAFDTFFEQRITPGMGLVGRVWESGRTIAVDDYAAWTGRLADACRDCLHAVVGVPLKSDGRVVGVIGLAYIEDGSRFGTEEIELLGQFGELASIALDNVRLYTAALQELQERERAEETLRKLSHAVEQSPASVIITDTAGTIEYVNPKFTEVTGYRADEAIGRNPRFLKSGETARSEYERLWEAITDGHEWRGEFQNRKKSGEIYWELASISPIRDTEGRITHFLAVKEDITERRRLESQLKHSQKMDAIGRLAGGIAHDFNNILTAIIGYASSLLMKADADPRLTNVLDQIIAAAERGAGLTQGLLSFSRKQVTNPKAVNLNDIVRRMEKLLVRLIGEDIELKTGLSAESPIVMADSMQIEQVLMNLVTNGRDAMPDGGRLTITTGLINLDSKFALTHGYGNPGVYAILEVSDAGSGMDAETVKQIFEPFYTTKEVGKGTGLGLSIVYGIVKKHNGYINCYSEPGKGSVFTVYLPAIRETAEQPLTPPPPRLAGGTETILLAEDDAAVRKITRDLLEEHGYRVIEAVDGEDALARFRKHWEEVHLLVLDVIMPKMNGTEVYDEISRMRPDIKAIFTSGYSAEIIQQKGMLDEGTICLPKPIPQQVLLARIREVLNNG